MRFSQLFKAAFLLAIVGVPQVLALQAVTDSDSHKPEHGHKPHHHHHHHDKVPKCGLPLVSPCTENSQCETAQCLVDNVVGLICQFAAPGGNCLENKDCVSQNCTFSATDPSYCKEANGTKAEVGTCQRAANGYGCYVDGDCQDGCECFPAATDSNFGFCFCG